MKAPRWNKVVDRLDKCPERDRIVAALGWVKPNGGASVKRLMRKLKQRYGIKGTNNIEKILIAVEKIKADTKLGIVHTPGVLITSKPSRDHVKKTREDKDAFYASWDWRTARMVALLKHGHRCMSCGATPKHQDQRGQPTRIVVDHIISIGTDWSRRLDPDNHQVLCDECNMGKGNWDTTDYR